MTRAPARHCHVGGARGFPSPRGGSLRSRCVALRLFAAPREVNCSRRIIGSEPGSKHHIALCNSSAPSDFSHKQRKGVLVILNPLFRDRYMYSACDGNWIPSAPELDLSSNLETRVISCHAAHRPYFRSLRENAAPIVIVPILEELPLKRRFGAQCMPLDGTHVENGLVWIVAIWSCPVLNHPVRVR